MNNEEYLKRIADALESIDRRLETMQGSFEALGPLAECVMKDRSGNNMLYVSGVLTT